MTNNNKFIPIEQPKTCEIGYVEQEFQTKRQPTASDYWISCPDEEEAKIMTKVGIGAASAVTGLFCPPTGAAVATAGGLGGKAMESIGEDTKDDGLKEAGKIFSTGTSIGGGVGSGTGKVAEKAVEGAIEEALKEGTEETIKNI